MLHTLTADGSSLDVVGRCLLASEPAAAMGSTAGILKCSCLPQSLAHPRHSQEVQKQEAARANLINSYRKLVWEVEKSLKM